MPEPNPTLLTLKDSSSVSPIFICLGGFWPMSSTSNLAGNGVALGVGEGIAIAVGAGEAVGVGEDIVVGAEIGEAVGVGDKIKGGDGIGVDVAIVEVGVASGADVAVRTVPLSPPQAIMMNPVGKMATTTVMVLI